MARRTGALSAVRRVSGPRLGARGISFFFALASLSSDGRLYLPGNGGF